MVFSGWFSPPGTEAAVVRHLAVGVYLAIQVVAKLCRTSVNLAASGQNTTRTLVASFLVLIISGAGLLMLPTASAENKENLSLIDALFTATSATCVTGLIVKDTGQDFSLMGQAARGPGDSGVRGGLCAASGSGVERARKGGNAGPSQRPNAEPDR
ncbi:MAG: hypothetical protein ACYSUD_17070 [Planctomycetota bacterium]